jgi:hypothetical protein
MLLAWKIQVADGGMIDRFAGAMIQVARASPLVASPPRSRVPHVVHGVIA